MKKRILTAVLCMLATAPILAQDSLAAKTFIQQARYINPPLITIKGEEFSRFPSTRFLDAVNGLFPWVFSSNPDPNNYIYIVNGHILSDINGISLYDIEEVSFARQMDPRYYPFTKAGTFYIKTKTVESRKPVISFNTQYNYSWNKARQAVIPPTAPSETKLNNGSGFLQTNHLSIATGNKDLHFYASAQAEFQNSPEAMMEINSNSGGSEYYSINTGNSRQLNLKAFTSLTYRFSEKVSAGFTANYAHSHTKADSTRHATAEPQGAVTDQAIQSKSPLSYYHLGYFVNVTPIKNLSNKLYFEYADFRNKYEKESYSFTDFGTSEFNTQFISNTRPSTSGLQIRNRLNYKISTGKWDVNIAALFSHVNQKLKSTSASVVTQNNQPMGASGSMYNIKQKITTLGPSLQVTYNNLVTAFTTQAFLLNKAGNTDLDKDSRRSSFSGITLHLRNLLKSPPDIDRLDLSFNHTYSTKDNSQHYWLHVHNPQSLFPTPVFSTSLVFFQAPVKLIKEELISIQANSSFMNGKLEAGAEWSKLQYKKIYITEIFTIPGPTLMQVPGIATQQGFSFYGAARLIDRPSRQWMTRLNFLLPESKHEFRFANSIYLWTETNYKFQAGLQNHFRFGSYYCQVHALLGLNREFRDYSAFPVAETRKENEFMLNYLLFGYNFNGKGKSIFRNASLFIQARNLFSDKNTTEYYQYDRYAGAGVNIRI